jgi:hypothetical protein
MGAEDPPAAPGLRPLGSFRLVHFAVKFNARGAKEVRRKLGYT